MNELFIYPIGSSRFFVTFVVVVCLENMSSGTQQKSRVESSQYIYWTVKPSISTHPKPRMSTVADYRPSTVRLQVKTLLPCIMLLTPEIEAIYY